MNEKRQYTPVFDDVLDTVGTIPAVIYGVIWRFCQMDSGKCTASLERIASRAGISKGNLKVHIKKLVDTKYLESELSPGKGVTYRLTELNLSPHPAQIKPATELNLSHKETLLRDSLRDSSELNLIPPDKADNWPIRDLATQITGLAPCSADIAVLTAWEKAGVTEADIRAAIAWRNENGKKPAKTIGQLAGGVETSRLKRIQSGNNGNHKRTDIIDYGN